MDEMAFSGMLANNSIPNIDPWTVLRMLKQQRDRKKYDLEFIGLFEFEPLKIVAVMFILQEEEPELASCKTKSFHMICRLDFIQRHRIENWIQNKFIYYVLR